MSNPKLCECGCGGFAPIADRNWHKRGIKKGQPLRFICDHHRRGIEQSKEEKIKRVKSWGKNDFTISPFLPGNRIARYHPTQKRWYCSIYGSSSSKPHARCVYEHHFGKLEENFVVHHKSGSAVDINEDRPDNLIAVHREWNLNHFPWLAKGFDVPESLVTEFYIKALNKECDIFTEVCKSLIEYKESK